MDWNSLANWLHNEIGYDVKPDKYYLLKNKCDAIIQEERLGDVPGLVAAARRDKGLRQRVINAVTVNETYFS